MLLLLLGLTVVVCSGFLLCRLLSLVGLLLTCRALLLATAMYSPYDIPAMSPDANPAGSMTPLLASKPMSATATRIKATERAPRVPGFSP